MEAHRELVLLHSNLTTITLLTSNTGFAFHSLGLNDCSHVAHLSDLLDRADELSSWSDRSVVKRDTLSSSALGSHWFESYVSEWRGWFT